MGALTRMVRSFDADAESQMPISKVQMGADLKALRDKRHLTSEAAAVRFNEAYAQYGITMSGSSLRSYERGETEIPARHRDLLVALYRAPAGLSFMADAYREDIAKALGIRKDH